MTDIKSISKLVTPIAEKYGADRVALFGSRAKKPKKKQVITILLYQRETSNLYFNWRLLLMNLKKHLEEM